MLVLLDNACCCPAILSLSQTEAADGDDIVDEEEFRLMRQLSAAKKAYRAQYQELRDAKANLAEAANALDECVARSVVLLCGELLCCLAWRVPNLVSSIMSCERC